MDSSSLSCSNGSVGPVAQLLGLLVASINSDQCNLLPQWPNDIAVSAIQNGLPEYDYIIIGASSSGSVVASRLTEDPNISVLLVEAGSNPPLESSVPGTHTQMVGTDVDWGFQTEPSLFSAKGTQNGTKFVFGKMLGGSGGLNDMLYIRGNRHDFDEWEYLTNGHWSFEHVLPYFKKSEDNQDAQIANNTLYHGTGGPLPVSGFNFTGPIVDTLESALTQLGFGNIVDINADKHIGYSSVQGTLVNGTRSSGGKAFLTLATERPNLHILKNAQVSHLRFKLDRSIAGVELSVGNVNITAVPKKEVILSAGPIGSSQILLNSGIGPFNQLANKNIKLINNLPVGLNLQDHINIPFIISYPDDTTLDAGNSFYNFLYSKSGVYSNIGLNNFVTYLNAYDSANPNPDVKFKVSALNSNDQSLQGFLTNTGYINDISNSIINANNNTVALAILVTLLKPVSRGHLELRSNNPADPPIIHTNYLKNPIDVETAIRGIRVAQKLLNTDAFKAINATYNRVNLPECDKLEYDSDAYWACYSRYMSSSDGQISGTNKMGYFGDPFAVVDPLLKVQGVRGLRVIDSSVIPITITGETSIAGIMIGEKGAAFIKDDISVSYAHPFYYPFLNKYL